MWRRTLDTSTIVLQIVMKWILDAIYLYSVCRSLNLRLLRSHANSRSSIWSAVEDSIKHRHVPMLYRNLRRGANTIFSWERQITQIPTSGYSTVILPEFAYETACSSAGADKHPMKHLIQKKGVVAFLLFVPSWSDLIWNSRVIRDDVVQHPRLYDTVKPFESQCFVQLQLL